MPTPSSVAPHPHQLPPAVTRRCCTAAIGCGVPVPGQPQTSPRPVPGQSPGRRRQHPGPAIGRTAFRIGPSPALRQLAAGTVASVAVVDLEKCRCPHASRSSASPLLAACVSFLCLVSASRLCHFRLCVSRLCFSPPSVLCSQRLPSFCLSSAPLILSSAPRRLPRPDGLDAEKTGRRARPVLAWHRRRLVRRLWRRALWVSWLPSSKHPLATVAALTAANHQL